MMFNNLCILALWTKVATALEGSSMNRVFDNGLTRECVPWTGAFSYLQYILPVWP